MQVEPDFTDKNK